MSASDFRDSIAKIASKKDRIYSMNYESHQGIPLPTSPLVGSSPSYLEEACWQYYSFGYSIIGFESETDPILAISSVSEDLSLGEAFIPKQYAGEYNPYDAHGYNVITSPSGPEPTYLHRAFATNLSQEIHSDGTLEDIGTVKTSILYCALPAAEGGETIVFNSVAAFVDLATRDASLAYLLTYPTALRRNDFISGNFSIGPAFSLNNGEIISRFSLDNTCDWEAGYQIHPRLREAVEYLQNLYKSPRFTVRFSLQKGQLLVLANDKVSHGRTVYADLNTTNKRQMVRALFRRRPSFPKK